jgi:opacity protein-like surface antigen
MRKFPWIAAVAALALLPSASARADSEVAFVLGASVSGNISVLQNGLDFQSIETAIKNSPLFGVRIGTYGFPIGFEGSLIYSPAALTGGAFSNLVTVKANILYTEANLLVIILPGPVAPFVTGGVGLHYLDFNVADLASLSKAKFGYNFGGGLKVNAARLALRVDIRDHVTTVGLQDAGLGILGDIFGLASTSARIHNVELSFGVGVRF